MNCKERLTIKYENGFDPKELCTINKKGEAVNCEGCGGYCNEHYFDDCEGCPVQKCFNKLGELEDNLENGTLIKLPYKVGNKTIKFENGEVVITSNSRNEV